MSFTRASLIRCVADHLSVSRVEAKRFVYATLKELAQALSRGERVSLRCLGAFRPRLRPPHKRGGAKVPWRALVLFSLSPRLRRPLLKVLAAREGKQQALAEQKRNRAAFARDEAEE